MDNRYEASLKCVKRDFTAKPENLKLVTFKCDIEIESLPPVFVETSPTPSSSPVQTATQKKQGGKKVLMDSRQKTRDYGPSQK